MVAFLTPAELECWRGGDCKPMVERKQVDLEVRNRDSNTPLLLEAYEGHLPMVQYMCEQGAEKEAMSGDGRTPLHRSAQYGHFPVVQYFEGLN